MAAALVACGDSGDPAAPTPLLTEAERQLGAGLLSPAESLPSVAALVADELPPETAAALAADDFAPSSSL